MIASGRQCPDNHHRAIAPDARNKYTPIQARLGSLVVSILARRAPVGEHNVLRSY